MVHGTVTLQAAPARAGSQQYNPFGNQPDTVSFETSPAGTGAWTTVATVPQAVDDQGNPLFGPDGSDPLYTFALDTKTTLGDGRYDVRVEAQDSSGGVYVGGVLSGVLVDNTPPTASLADPGGSLSGVVNLHATATDSGSGVASVRFQVSPSGADTWSTIGLQVSAPYQQSFDTRGLQNGRYDLRVTATDVAGNSTTSSVVAGVTISNGVTSTSPASFAITDYAVPATNISLLGTIAGSPDGETWAYGYTTAPPAIVDGQPLPYTVPAGNDELVLLRYTDETGWQIADVLRKADGSAYPLLAGLNPAGGGSVAVTGQMAPSGEAWLLLLQHSRSGTTTALFHRQAGGQFREDTGAESDLHQTVLSSAEISQQSPVLTVGEDPTGAVYGLLLNPKQFAVNKVVGTTSISTRLVYGSLADGHWTAPSAQLPSTYAPSPNDSVTLAAASATGPGAGWAAISVTTSSGSATTPLPLMLASFSSSGWSFVNTTGLDALDLTGNFATGAALTVTPVAIAADGLGVWVDATNSVGTGGTHVIALIDPGTGHVVASWCGQAVFTQSVGCGQPWTPTTPRLSPTRSSRPPSGPVAVALANGFVDVYAHGVWTTDAASGFSRGSGGQHSSLFSGPTGGWLAGTYALGRITATAPAARWRPGRRPTRTRS